MDVIFGWAGPWGPMVKADRSFKVIGPPDRIDGSTFRWGLGFWGPVVQADSVTSSALQFQVLCGQIYVSIYLLLDLGFNLFVASFEFQSVCDLIRVSRCSWPVLAFKLICDQIWLLACWMLKIVCGRIWVSSLFVTGFGHQVDVARFGIHVVVTWYGFQALWPDLDFDLVKKSHFFLYKIAVGNSKSKTR